MIHDLEIMIGWFKANQLSLNLSKSVLIYFWEKRNQTQPTVDDIEIPISDSTKFLGVHIDNELRWTIHVNNLHKKLMANKFLLSTNTNILNTNSLRLIYNVHILSHLTYGLLAWGPMASKEAIKDLTSIQDSCVHLVSKVGKSTNVMPLYNKQQLIWLPDLIKLELAKYGHRQTTKDYPASLQQIANANGGTKKHHYPTRSKNTD